MSFEKGTFIPPAQAERKISAHAEFREIDFETAKKELETFLETYYADFIASSGSEMGDLTALDHELVSKLRAVAQSQPQQVALEYLTSLVVNDKMDGSTVPNIFRLRSDEEWQQIDPYAFDDGLPSQDIITSLSSINEECEDQRTYRTILYPAVVQSLTISDSSAHICILSCLEKIDNVATTQEKTQDEIENQKDNKNNPKSSKGEDTQWEDEYVDRITRDNFSVGYGPLGTEDEFNILFEFTSTKQAIFDAFEKMKISLETVSYLVQRISDHPGDIHENFYQYIAVLNNHASHASQELLKLLKTEEDPITRALVTRTLYHIELGKIGMSEDGLKYLDKVFDLGQYNDPRYDTHRVTGDGKIGLFDKDDQNRAVGFFQLRDLDSDEDRLKAEVLQFSYETLFISKPDETEEERAEREAILEDFKKNYFETYLEGFYEETGVNFNNLDFREQGWFLWYVQHADEGEKKRVIEFVKQYREPGFKAFLSLEHDREMGEAILAISEKLDRETAEKIYRVYGQLVEESDRVEELLEDFFVDKPPTDLDSNKITYEILKRGKDLLADFAEKARVENVDSIIQKLQATRVDLITFASIFRTTFKGEKIDFESVKGVSLGHYPSAEIPNKLRTQIAQIATENHETGLTHADVLLENALKMSRGETTDTVYILTKEMDEETVVLSFTRFKAPGKDGDRYWGSFNVNTKYRGSALGEAMLQNVVECIADQYKLEATVFSPLTVGTDYVDKRGFVITGVDDKLASTYGEIHFTIKLDKEKNHQYKLKDTKKVSHEDVINLYSGENPSDDNTDAVLVYRLPVANQVEINRVVRYRTSQGYVGTRYFIDPQDSQFRYYSFERDPEVAVK